MPNSIVVKITGPEAEQAFAELLSNIQYDNLEANATRVAEDLVDAIKTLEASADATGCTDDLTVVSAEALKQVVSFVEEG